MKKTIKTRLVLFLFSILGFVISPQAQKDSRIFTEKRQGAQAKGHITKEIEARIIEIVKPVKEKIESLYKEDQTGTFTAYSAAIQKLGGMKDEKEKRAFLKTIEKTYYPFVKKIWDQAKIDDAYYQLKLKSLFPDNIKETIRFGEFLNFTMGGSSQKDPPPPAPAPANICLDANAFFKGAMAQDGGAIGGSKVQVHPVNPPSPPEIVTGATTAILGVYYGAGWLLNTISIPGNFPFDSKMLRIKKSFDWTGTYDAFSILGCSWSTTAYTTNGNAHDFNVDGEIYTAVAPVTFVMINTKMTSKTEESLVAKTDLPTAHFGIECYSTASASVYLSFANAGSMCAMWKWEVCEE